MTDTFNIKEIDLRQEFEDSLMGNDFGNIKFIPYIHQKIRIDTETFRKVKCTCFDQITEEGSRGCGSCNGIGYLWDEFIIPGFIYPLSNTMLQSGNQEAPTGKTNNISVKFITRYTEEIRISDFIIEPELTNDGAFYAPYTVRNKYIVNHAREARLDFGKNEFSQFVLRSF